MWRKLIGLLPALAFVVLAVVLRGWCPFASGDCTMEAGWDGIMAVYGLTHILVSGISTETLYITQIFLASWFVVRVISEHIQVFRAKRRKVFGREAQHDMIHRVGSTGIIGVLCFLLGLLDFVNNLLLTAEAEGTTDYYSIHGQVVSVIYELGPVQFGLVVVILVMVHVLWGRSLSSTSGPTGLK